MRPSPSPTRKALRLTSPEDNRPPAAAPGTLIHVGERRVDEVHLRIIDYNGDSYQQVPNASVEDCLNRGNSDTVSWIQVTGLHDITVISRLLDGYGIHPLVQEDVVNTRHRLKMEDFGDYIFLAVKELDDSGNDQELRHLSILLAPGFVISFQEAPSQLFAPIEDRMGSSLGMIREQGADYLVWAILDAVADNFRIVVDQISDEVEELEAVIYKGDTKVDMDRLHQIKRHVEHLMRAATPLQEIGSSLQRLESPLLSPKTSVFWSDLQDHAVHVVSSVEILRESLVSLRDFHIATLSQRMNEVMKVLTSFAAIFLPISFLAGVYGMNFKNMPEYSWKYAYVVIWILFAAIIGGMVVYFRRKDWM